MDTRADAIGNIAGKLTVASGAGGAAYATVSGETLIALVSLAFTAAAFFVNWHYERKKAAREEQRLEHERVMAQQRLDMEKFDRAEQRRIMEAAWAKAEKRRKKESEARITEMARLGKPIFHDTGMTPSQLGGVE